MAQKSVLDRATYKKMSCEELQTFLLRYADNLKENVKEVDMGNCGLLLVL